MNLANIGDQKFSVIQKISTFRALENLNGKGEFKKLIGHNQGLLMCYVVNPGRTKTLVMNKEVYSLLHII